MIKVKVRTSHFFSRILGHWKFQVSLDQTTTFRGLVDQLVREYGKELGDYLLTDDRRFLSPGIMFMINGRNIRFLQGEQTILADSDQVTILLPAGGG